MTTIFAAAAGVTLFGWFNIILAALGALVSLGAANRMTVKTECTIKIAFATVGVGCIAWVVGTFAPDKWQTPFETLLLGGIVALLIGTRKQTIWLAPGWMPWISISVSAATWIAFFAGVT